MLYRQHKKVHIKLFYRTLLAFNESTTFSNGLHSTEMIPDNLVPTRVEPVSEWFHCKVMNIWFHCNGLYNKSVDHFMQLHKCYWKIRCNPVQTCVHVWQLVIIFFPKCFSWVNSQQSDFVKAFQCLLFVSLPL